MEEISKSLARLTRIIVKYIPFVIAIGYLLMAIFSCFGISCIWLPVLFRFSISSFVCLFAISILLKFCIWHRLPLYYAITIDIINTVDYYFVIPISSKVLLLIYLVISIMFILVGMYLKEKHNVKNRTT
jgi:hypothetical protein